MNFFKFLKIFLKILQISSLPLTSDQENTVNDVTKSVKEEITFLTSVVKKNRCDDKSSSCHGYWTCSRR